LNNEGTEVAYVNRTKVLLTGWLANETAEGSI